MTTIDQEITPGEEVKILDLKGDLHFHLAQHGDAVGNWTGSHDSEIEGEKFIDWALEQLPGLQYFVASDHLELWGYDRSRFHPGDKYGIEHLYDFPELIQPQLERVRALNGYKGVTVIPGVEASIQRSGNVNATDRVLELFDVVIASDHYYENGGDAAEVTRRYLAALQNPHTDILGHPARKHPDWQNIDWLAIAQIAKAKDKAIEVNMTPAVEYGIPERKNIGRAEPSRDQEFLKVLASTGVKVAISGDTHKIQPLRENSPLSLSQNLALHKLVRDLNAAGITKSQILNTYSADQLVSWARGNNHLDD